MEDTEFIKLLETTSFTELGRRLHISGNAVKKRAKKLGVYYPRKTYNEHNLHLKKTIYCKECQLICNGQMYKKRKFCSNSCATINIQRRSYEKYIQKWKNGLESGIRGKIELSKHIRHYMLDKYEHKCVKCGWGKANPITGKSTLQVNHIDGNCRNNVESNLELLCPNCHSLTDTWGSINKVAGRRKILALC
jgi:endogenous inhibitor of DNA gyrase (YacG/DUF329 family)